MASSLESEIKKKSSLLPKNNCLVIQASCLGAIAFLTHTYIFLVLDAAALGWIPAPAIMALPAGLPELPLPPAFEAHTPRLIPKGSLNMPRIQNSGVDQVLGKVFLPWKGSKPLEIFSYLRASVVST